PGGAVDRRPRVPDAPGRGLALPAARPGPRPAPSTARCRGHPGSLRRRARLGRRRLRWPEVGVRQRALRAGGLSVGRAPRRGDRRGSGRPGGEGGTTGSPPGPAPTTYRHAFEALNDALGATGVVIRVPAGLVVSDPIQLVYLSDPVSDPVGQAVLSSPRSTVVAGPGSSVGLVEHFVGHPDAAGMTNAVTTVRCAEGARVDVDRVQDEAPADFHLSLLDVRQDRGSRFSCRSFALGGSIARHE